VSSRPNQYDVKKHICDVASPGLFDDWCEMKDDAIASSHEMTTPFNLEQVYDRSDSSESKSGSDLNSDDDPDSAWIASDEPGHAEPYFRSNADQDVDDDDELDFESASDSELLSSVVSIVPQVERQRPSVDETIARSDVQDEKHRNSRLLDDEKRHRVSVDLDHVPDDGPPPVPVLENVDAGTLLVQHSLQFSLVKRVEHVMPERVVWDQPAPRRAALAVPGKQRRALSSGSAEGAGSSPASAAGKPEEPGPAQAGAPRKTKLAPQPPSASASPDVDALATPGLSDVTMAEARIIAAVMCRQRRYRPYAELTPAELTSLLKRLSREGRVWRLPRLHQWLCHHSYIVCHLGRVPRPPPEIAAPDDAERAVLERYLRRPYGAIDAMRLAPERRTKMMELLGDGWTWKRVRAWVWIQNNPMGPATPGASPLATPTRSPASTPARSPASAPVHRARAEALAGTEEAHPAVVRLCSVCGDPSHSRKTCPRRQPAAGTARSAKLTAVVRQEAAGPAAAPDDEAARGQKRKKARRNHWWWRGC
jgi:hypothetical protein